ncbi:cuticle protein 7-like [Toxorhynchites rutilus septentrionalis]|uniref:cuticle protein 7-like n=1 Tax=Toxorhynchites rutilus septentrionalis TaxID=329112 RepID=UPI00247AD841|nr:cuticle protein 7-like [Toxorhynchites rutilus septentrionalis]
MASKFVTLFALFAAAAAQHYGSNDYQQPQYHAQPALLKTIQPALVKTVQPTLVKAVKHEEYPDTPAEYQFAYEVHDDHTGDIKSHHEERNGDNVKGYYTLVDADGYRRIVEYSVDGHSGFNAVVRREPLEGHKIVKAVAPVTKIVAPVKVFAQAPVHHYQPAPAKVYSAPVAKAALPAVAKVAYASHQKTVNHVQFSGHSTNYNY